MSDNFGVVVEMGDGGATETFATVGELTTVPEPGVTSSVRKKHVHRAPGDPEFGMPKVTKSAKVEQKDWTIANETGLPAASIWTDLNALVKSTEPRNFRATFPDGSVFTGPFFVTEVSRTGQDEDAGYTATLVPAGAITES